MKQAFSVSCPTTFPSPIWGLAFAGGWEVVVGAHHHYRIMRDEELLRTTYVRLARTTCTHSYTTSNHAAARLKVVYFPGGGEDILCPLFLWHIGHAANGSG